MGLAVAALVGREQPRAVARLGDVGPHRLPVLRRRDGRGVLRRSLERRNRCLSELETALARLGVAVGEPERARKQLEAWSLGGATSRT